MTLINNEQELETFFQHNQLAVITHFLTENCEDCQELLSVFEEVSIESGYEKINFGLMHAEAGSIAENLVVQRQMPFVAIYKNGEMIKCGSVNSEKEFRKMLRRF